MQTKEKLNPDYLLELFYSFFNPKNKDLLEVCISELDYTFLPNEEFKFLWSEIKDYYSLFKKAPTQGYLAQQFNNKKKVLDLLLKLKTVLEIDKDSLFTQLEEYIKEGLFLRTYDDLADIWNEGDKKKAYKVLMQTAQDIQDYSLTKNKFTKVLKGFESRYEKRKVENDEANRSNKTKKIPLYIDEQDDLIKGGMDRGDTYIYIGQSGKFKSTALRYHAISAASLGGYNVVHFQAEDTEETTTNLYDSSLLGDQLWKVEQSKIDDSKFEKVKSNIKRLLNSDQGEVYLKVFERFSDATLGECRTYLQELEREVGEIHLIVFDYLELFNPSDGVKYGASQTREKREAVANKMKNLAMEFNSAVITASQSMDIPKVLDEDPTFVMTRNHISEFKGLVKPFSGVWTLNQTPDEAETGVMRIYNDKYRKYKSRQIVKIFQAIESGKFVDTFRTKQFYAKEK